MSSTPPRKTEAKIIADTSSVKHGVRITTFEMTVPRSVWSEVLTHCMLARSARSSRAVPIDKMIAEVMEYPYIPPIFGANRPGMKATEAVSEPEEALKAWLDARDSAVEHAWRLQKLGCHKQIVNRVLEPFGWIVAVVTATFWDGFLNLRDHEDAEPNLQILAKQVRAGLATNSPAKRDIHLPYLSDEEIRHVIKTRDAARLGEMARISVGRCARVSYRLFDGSTSEEADIELGKKLEKVGHLGPMEHQAVATPLGAAKFNGWSSVRAFAPGEASGIVETEFDFVGKWAGIGLGG